MDDDAPSASESTMQTSEHRASSNPGIDDLFAQLLGPEVYAPSTTLLDPKPTDDDSGIEDYLDSLAADAHSSGHAVSEFVTSHVTSAKKGLEHLFSLLLG